jgi:hypothetical protein
VGCRRADWDVCYFKLYCGYMIKLIPEVSSGFVLCDAVSRSVRLFAGQSAEVKCKLIAEKVGPVRLPGLWLGDGEGQMRL